MSEKINRAINTTTQFTEPETTDNYNQLSRKVQKLSAIALDNYDDSFNLQESMNDAKNHISALCAGGNLQEMIAAQMIAVHQLQQVSAAVANRTTNLDVRQYFTNTAIKLANCFTQQAALLAKLQGVGGQKIVVEHVEVHQGGQAVVGNISGGIPSSKEKK